ncbi:hypothetical protein PSI22_14165 [Xenorhabdus sp. XENO-7]|uniref:Transposase n=1 Tax=Xenorhabdus aichiensis TaxID=3025874 RepID=A0ABT5M4Z2_9GAMM|nr:hypothetical protein [Xenorhabdus aichiensis]MDC9622749.1 hypothetical protein [Xenorhabdus aichiensis]
MLLLVMSAKKPLDRIEIAFTLLAKAWKILFFNGVTAAIIHQTDKEKKDLRNVSDVMTRQD